MGQSHDPETAGIDRLAWAWNGFQRAWDAPGGLEFI